MHESIGDIQASLETQTPQDIITQAIERAEADVTNSFTEVDSDAADRPTGEGPLRGVPVALKDLIDHRGHITTAGSAFYRHQPNRSATVVDRLESAGAAIIGRTGLHEFAYGFSSENAWFGPVRNPWNPDLSPGGSSGGSAAAVAAGIIPAAIGTDTGGSVRVPAALCGIHGLKVTHGRVPLTGVFPLAESLDTVGPLARSCADLGTVYDVIRGFDPDDPWSTDVDEEPTGYSGLEALTIGIPHDWLAVTPTSAPTREMFSRTVDRLTDLGVDTVDVSGMLPSPHIVTLSAAEAAGVHRSWFTDIDKQYGPDVEERLANAMEVTVDQLVEAKRWQAGLVQAVRTAFSSCDVIMTPTVGDPHKTIGVDDMDIDGQSTFYRPVLSGFTALVNQFWCPAIALPLDEDGTPPPSIQLIAPWWHERLLLEIGSDLEDSGLVAARRPPA